MGYFLPKFEMSKIPQFERRCPEKCVRSNEQGTPAVRANTRDWNNGKALSAERMQKLRQHRKVNSSSVASDPGVASTSRAAKAIRIDTNRKHPTQIQVESEDKWPNLSQRDNMSPLDSSDVFRALTQLSKKSYVWLPMVFREFELEATMTNRPLSITIARTFLELPTISLFLI